MGGGKHTHNQILINTPLLRRLFFVSILLTVVFQSKSASLLEYSHSIPENNAEITTFDIKLVFDLSKVVETYGEDEYGVGIGGEFDPDYPDPDWDMYTALYEGEGESKVFLDAALTYDIKGNSSEFQTGNEVLISFPNQIPVPGKTYTIECTNYFAVYVKGSKTIVKNTNIDFQGNPIVLTFKAGQASSDVLVIEDCSIASNSSMSDFKEITYTFNHDIELTGNGTINMLDNNSALSETKSITVHGNTLTAEFDNTTLLNKHLYTIELPSGFVSVKDNPSLTNTALTTIVNGIGFNTFALKSTSPENNSTSIFSQIAAEFDLPEGYKMMTSMGVRSNFKANLYKNEVADENLISVLDGTISEDGRSLSWSVEYVDPATKYVLYIPKHQFSAWQDKKNEDWANDEVLITLNTPSVEDSNIPQMEFGEPIIGSHGVSTTTLTSDKPVSHLDRIDIAFKDLFYYYNGKKSLPFIEAGSDRTAYLYDVTGDSETLIKEMTLNVQTRENSIQYYSVVSMSVSNYFFEGHKYRIVIPEGRFTVSDQTLWGYVRNQELSYEFFGSMPASVELTNCSMKDNAEMSELFNVVWTFKGEYVLNPEAKAVLKSVSGLTTTNTSYLLTSSSLSGNTTVVAHIYNGVTGGPLALDKNTEYTLTLPAGAIYYPGNPDLKNDEIVMNIIPVEKKPEVIEPEFVNLDVCINGLNTTSIEAIKERKTRIALVPDENWTVESLKRDGTDVLPILGADGVYTTPALEEDCRIDATVAYSGKWMVEQTSGVFGIENSSVRVYAENGMIVVEGLAAGDVVKVFSTAGVMIDAVNAVQDRINITVQPGQVYIVVVNGSAAKIRI